MDKGIDSTVIQYVGQPSKPWFPHLHVPLTSYTWQQLEINGFDIENYRTHRWMEKNPTAECVVPAELILDDRQTIFCRIEALPESSRLGYEQQGMVFQKQFSKNRYLEPIRSALAFISTVLSLYHSVSGYLRVLHILQAPNMETDVHYSDPSLPFSIFVSVSTDGQCRTLRLAESIIHECMHLQLTLIESVLPLVADEDAYTYSPWRRIQRPLRGVLHGLYVFAVIHAFYRELNCEFSLQPTEEEYVIKRQDQIAEEISQIDRLALEEGLTIHGQILTRSVWKSFEK